MHADPDMVRKLVSATCSNTSERTNQSSFFIRDLLLGIEITGLQEMVVVVLGREVVKQGR